MADQVGIIDVIYAYVARWHRFPTWQQAGELASKYTDMSSLKKYVEGQNPDKMLEVPSGSMQHYLAPFAGANVWMLQIPELARTMVRASVEHWSDTRIVGATQSSKWWKTHNEAQRSWASLNQADRGRLIDQTAYDMSTRYFDIYGERVDPATLRGVASQVAAGSLTLESWISQQQSQALTQNPESPYARQIRSEQEAQRQRGVDIENLSGNLQQDAQTRYLLPTTEEQMSDWAAKIAANQASQDDFYDWARTQAAGLFPAFQQQISNGVDPATLLGSYQDLASKELERTVDWRDPTLWNAITNPDGAPTLSQFQRQVRATDEWRRTMGAQQLADQLVTTLGQRFGKVAG